MRLSQMTVQFLANSFQPGKFNFRCPFQRLALEFYLRSFPTTRTPDLKLLSRNGWGMIRLVTVRPANRFH